MRSLALDTATATSAVALLDGDRCLGERQVEAGGHSRGLLALIEELLGEVGWARRELQAVVVGVGPGSFTGVRIGLTVAKTLAYAGGLRLLGVSSLRALAENGRALAADELCPALDALKGEVFSARLRGAEVLEPEDARAPAAWARGLAAAPARRVFLGSGALRYRELLLELMGEQAIIPDTPGLHRISAAALGRLGAPRLERGERHDPRSLEPLYCRLSEAELGLRRTQPENSR